MTDKDISHLFLSNSSLLRKLKKDFYTKTGYSVRSSKIFQQFLENFILGPKEKYEKTRSDYQEKLDLYTSIVNVIIKDYVESEDLEFWNANKHGMRVKVTGEAKLGIGSGDNPEDMVTLGAWDSSIIYYKKISPDDKNYSTVEERHIYFYWEAVATKCYFTFSLLEEHIRKLVSGEVKKVHLLEITNPDIMNKLQLTARMKFRSEYEMSNIQK